MAKPVLINQKIGLPDGSVIFLSAISLNQGSDSQTNNKESIKANRAMNTDSQKNWTINCARNDPAALRMPISRALFSLLAVLRFIKLIQARSRTNAPIRANSQTYWMAPPALTPFLNSEYKCHLLIGCRKICG